LPDTGSIHSTTFASADHFSAAAGRFGPFGKCRVSRTRRGSRGSSSGWIQGIRTSPCRSILSDTTDSPPHRAKATEKPTTTIHQSIHPFHPLAIIHIHSTPISPRRSLLIHHHNQQPEFLVHRRSHTPRSEGLALLLALHKPSPSSHPHFAARVVTPTWSPLRSPRAPSSSSARPMVGHEQRVYSRSRYPPTGGSS
jgi:hypothetical protein